MSFPQISQITMFVKREIVVDCWQCTYSYEIIKWYVNFHINLNISFWSQISFSYTLSFNASNLCAPTLITWPKLMSKHEQTKSYKNNSLTDHIFSYRIWLAYHIFYSPTLFTDFVYACEKKQTILRLIFNYTVPFLYKSGKVSIIDHKYDIESIEIVPLPVSCIISANILKQFFWLKFE